MYTKESLKNSTLTELRQIAENLKLGKKNLVRF